MNIEKLQSLFDKPIYTVFDYNGDYAVVLDDDSETIYIVDSDLFNIMRLTTFYSAEGGHISANCNIIYDAERNL